MSLPNYSQNIQKNVHETADLFVAGADLLLALVDDSGRVSFNDWAKELSEQRKLDRGSATNAQLEWLWDVIRTAPRLTLQFGCLPPAAEPWAGSTERFKVFGAGEWFVIGMKLTDVTALLSTPAKSPLKETVAVQIEQELNLRPGKGGRLECCDCEAEVTIRVEQPYAVSREADIMRIEESRITLGDGIVKVRVNSLNQAYTVSSRRLEPDRRSHGGRTYDHVVHSANGKRTLLENIRKQVESGDWEVASAPPAIGKTGNKVPSDYADEVSVQMTLKEVVRTLEAAGVECAWKSSDLTTLDSIQINELSLPDAVYKLIERIPNLNSLEADRSNISDSTLVYIRHLKSLETLDLRHTSITGDGLRHLQGLVGLRHLCLMRTAVTDDSLRYLQGLVGLQQLNLARTPILGSGLRYLRNLTSLSELLVSGFQHNDRWLQMLRQELPQCKIYMV